MTFRDPAGAHRNAGIPLVGAVWTERDIQDDDVAGVIFQDCTFDRVRLTRANLEQSMFLNSRFEDCVFEDCRILRTNWVGSTGSGLRITGGVFADAMFSECKFEHLHVGQSGERMVLAQCEIEELSLEAAGRRQTALTLSDCRFGRFHAENADWRHCSLVGVDLTACAFEGACFDQCSFVGAKGEGVDFSSVRFKACNIYQAKLGRSRFRWAQGTIFAECDLAQAHFVEADAEGALFSKANAAGARFERARLDGALFPGAVLTQACFAGATARQSAWIQADLTGADLTGLDAFRASFRNAVLKEADVTNARLVESELHGVEETLGGADLRDARGTIPWRAERERELEDRREHLTGLPDP